MQSNVKRQKLILTSILLMGLFTYPVISIANKRVMVAGIPLLFLYVLLVWIIAIIVFASITNTKQRKEDE
ncbi:MAG TPA: hypothetical protein PLY34_14895 [Ferruginibacter sp.]|nr:hypothetical protein [Ferruginibacter sp.]HPH92131.1 hypothetical protein [Ferruginibacter sp.]